MLLFGVTVNSTHAEYDAIVAAWQSGAISRDTMFELFRKGGNFAGRQDESG
jgi:hypothetical protein